MPRKKQTKEEILLKAKMARKQIYAKIKADPALYALEKEKEHQRYIRRKEQKKIQSIQEMTPRARRLQRKKWRENFKKHYQKKLLLKKGLQLIDANTPSCSDSEDPLGGDEADNENAVVKEQEEPGKSDKRNRRQGINSDKRDENEDPSNASPHRQRKLVENMKKKLGKLRRLMLKKESMFKSQIKLLQREVQRYKKILQRVKVKLRSLNSRVTQLIKDKSKLEEAKKKILFGEAMKKTLEINFSSLQSKKDKRQFSDLVMKEKEVLKGYKVLSETKKFTVRAKDETMSENAENNKLKADIQEFYERDDVSRITAGFRYIEFFCRCSLSKHKCLEILISFN